MTEKRPIVDQQTAVEALNQLIDAINCTGGVVPAYDDIPLEQNTPTPAADPVWLDLGMAYQVACRVLGVPMQWAVDGPDEQDVAVSTTEE